MRYPNGDSYDGQWKASEQEGQGVYTFAGGRTYAGAWRAGDYEGHGVYEDADGSVCSANAARTCATSTLAANPTC